MKQYGWFFLLFLCTTAACRRSSKPLSFYYWKTQFSLNDFEKSVLNDHAVTTLYIRYFDVDFKPEETAPAPISPIKLNSTLRPFAVVPVIFIKNRTFERLDSTAVALMAKNVFRLVSQINQSQQITTREIQFDCDWTDRTRNSFFYFIQQYRAISQQTISATIRLHQVKYKERTGIPPVDYGVLMYYNMANIDGGTQNSIYEKSIAGRYNAFIRNYPLALDVALPVFSWAYTIREGKVVELLNKMNLGHFKNDTNFTQVNNSRFLTKHACFKAGYYFRQNDVVKLEHVPAEDLVSITEQINRYSNHRIGKVVLYDLDSSNLIQYEKGIFKKVLANLH
jgi:hypothetical protein